MRTSAQSEFESGILGDVSLSAFNQEEQKIIRYLSKKYWKITRAENISISRSTYKLILMKPSPEVTHGFNLHREIIVAFSPYESFEPRSIDAIEYPDIQELRLEEICTIIISKDNDVESKLNSILKTNPEARIIIPFSYSELLKNENDDEYVLNKFRKNFYSRDLFGIQAPLKKDLYFFGRNDLIHSLVNNHLTGENSGVFGLRKTGKTSILYGVERALSRKQSISVIIDCQTMHLKSWNLALWSIVDNLREKGSIKISELNSQEKYNDSQLASDCFYDDIQKIYSRIGKRKILLIFDEVEHITFDTSISDNWKSGIDFIKFWQVIRGGFQKNPENNRYTFLITGTNPKCVEQGTINKVDNPIFAQFLPTYIPPFNYEQTKEMLDKLGGYMGMEFDEATTVRLVEDFGGHPLLSS